MMLPSIFGENLLDNWFDDGWNSWDYSNTSLMNTDIKANDNDYGKYIRRERYSGSCNRSFYVGDAITEEDIKANFENGTLKMTIPKKEAKAVPEKKFISIEG